MTKLVITATDDIPSTNICSLIKVIGTDKCHDSTSRMALNNTDPPSFIEILGSIITWKTVLGASATVFFSRLAHRLADDAYDNKKIIGEALFSPVRLFASAIVRTIKEIPRNSFIKIEIAAPIGVPNPAICFLDESEAEIAFKLSCVYAVGDMIIEKLVKVSTRYDSYLMPASILVSENGDVTVKCHAGSNNDLITFTISLLEPI